MKDAFLSFCCYSGGYDEGQKNWSTLRMRADWQGFHSSSVQTDCAGELHSLWFGGDTDIDCSFSQRRFPGGSEGPDWSPARQSCTDTLLPVCVCVRVCQPADSHLLAIVASGSSDNFTWEQVRMWQANCRRMHNLADWISGRQNK